MDIRHYYHLYLDGDTSWRDIATEYAQVLKQVDFPATPVVGLVGKYPDSARSWIDDHDWVVGAEVDRGFEQVTLSIIQNDLSSMSDNTAVLYTHAKGAWRNTSLEDQWRRSMLWHLVFGWQHCVELLEENQIVGCHWTGSYFAGNFWWARSDYLRTLPPVTGVSEADRGQAEMWIGRGNPVRVVNLVEGRPPKGTEPGSLLASERLPPRPIRRHPVQHAADRSAPETGTGSVATTTELGELPTGDVISGSATGARIPGCR